MTRRNFFLGLFALPAAAASLSESDDEYYFCPNTEVSDNMTFIELTKFEREYANRTANSIRALMDYQA